MLTNTERRIEIRLSRVNYLPPAIFMRVSLSPHDDARFLHKLLTPLSHTGHNLVLPKESSSNPHPPVSHPPWEDARCMLSSFIAKHCKDDHITRFI